MSIKLFHVSSNTYKPGEKIIPHCVYQGDLKEEKAEMEAFLEQAAPPGVERSKCVFLFCDLSAALRFARKYSGNIYEVSPNGPILHRGDMNKLDNILDVFRFTDDQPLRLAVVNEYWKAGTHTFSPCYEFLVSECKVVGIVALFHEIMEIDISLPIEQTEQYRTLFINTYCL